MAVTFLTNEDEKRILNEANAGKLLTAPQELTEEEKAQARKNIGAVSTGEHTALKETVQTTAQDLDRVAEVVEDAVLTTGQVLTEDQKAQARANIGAGSKIVEDSLSARLANGSVTLVDEREGIAETLFLARDNLHMTVRDKVETVIATGYQYLTEEQKAQARDNIGAISANEIPQSEEKVYEKIATITVTPDADGSLPQYVTFTADSNGNPFELTDFIVQARAGFVDGNKSGLYMSVNNNKLVIGNSAVTGISTALRSFTIFYRLESDGSVRAEHTVSGSSATFYNPANAINESRVILPAVMTGFMVPTVTKIDLYTLVGDTKAWVEGSTFELWGVRV